MIVTDGNRISSTTSLFELHKFARDMKISFHFYFGHNKGRPHYKRPKMMTELQLRSNGAELVTPKELLLASKKLYKNLQESLKRFEDI